MMDGLPDWIQPPDDTPEFMYGDWLSCLQWAVGFEPIRTDFEAETGMKFIPRAPIEAMIDTACGHSPTEDYFRAFVPWFNQWVWGSMEEKEDQDV